MSDDTILGGVLNQLGQTAKKAVQQAVKLPEEGSQDTGRENPKAQNPDAKTDEERIKFLKDLYGPLAGSDLKQGKNEKPSGDKSPEEQKKLIELRNQLHKEEYYDPTFNPVKKQEERPAEKVENEKKQEMVELQKKDEKKPQPLVVVREQNKAEQFRGAAG